MSPAYRRALCGAILSFAVLLAMLPGAAVAAAATPTQTVAEFQGTLEVAMLNLLNVERTANHKPALVSSSALHASAHAHNLGMARVNKMEHQVPGEAPPGTRITKSGYNWSYWGENIGWTSVETVASLQSLENYMYHEKAPDDGHRLNILGNFKNVGIDVYIDPVHHVMWFTQDFGLPK
jgi:uncharacterized protein YkwD